MYRVVILDDEPWVVKGIRNTFKWDDYGFEVIAEATDPLAAFDIIVEKKPDAVLTDIRMPEVSGIELMKMSREQGISAEFVIISGIADFQYAQESIRLGCFDYLLKPLQFKDADILLERLGSQLEHKNRQYEERLLDALFQEDIAQIKQLLEDRGFRTKPGQCYQVVYSTGPSRHKNFFSPEWPGITDQLLIEVDHNKRLLLLSCEGDCSRLLQDMNRGIAVDGGPFSMGISPLSSSVEDLPKLVEAAHRAMHSAFIYTEGGIFSEERSSHRLIRSAVHELYAAMRIQPVDQLSAQLKAIPALFRKEGAGMKEVSYLWNQVVAALNDKGAACRKELVFMDYPALVNQFANLEEMCGYLTQILIGEGASSIQDQPVQINDNFKKLLDYVNRHYNEELRLRELSTRFYINYTYCCDLFQKVTQSTFTDYVTRLRMKKTEQLLKEENGSILDICEQVGYSDYSYFIKVFKKWYGVTPSSYRRNSQFQ